MPGAATIRPHEFPDASSFRPWPASPWSWPAYRAYGWPGIAIAVTGIVMWMLLHFTRMMKVLKRAGNRPIGFVDSAVMLNAKLRPGLTCCT
jgi:hypothetical protein